MATNESFFDSIALISSTDKNITKFGTAFAIFNNQDKTLFLTCAHVVRDVGGINCVKVNSDVGKVIVLGSADGPDDIAIIDVRCSKEIPPLFLSTDASPNDNFETVGFQSFDKQFMLRTLKGVLGNQVNLETLDFMNRVKAWDLIILDDNGLQPGYSGSPVISQANGKVIGIVSHRQGGGKKGLAISVETLEKLWLQMPPEFLDQKVVFEERQIRQVIGILPQNVTALFKNRFSEAEKLREYLKTAKIISVVGHGGTGKTALVCKVLSDIEKSNEPITGLIYFTAANLQTISLENIFTAIGRILSQEKEMIKLYNDLQMPLETRINLLISKIPKDNTYIMLLDNFERYQDDNGNILDAELAVFIEMALVQHSGLKILITTRAPLRLPITLVGLYKPLVLDQGLQIEYAIQLLYELDPDNLGGVHSADKSILYKLAEHAQCYPKALQAVVGLLREDLMLTPSDLLSEEPFSGNVINGLVRDSLSRLDDSAIKVMQGLAVYGEPISESALLYLLEPFLDIDTTQKTIRRLAQSHFITLDKVTKKFSLHPIDHAYVYQRLCSSRKQIKNIEFTREHLALRAADYFASLRLPRDKWQLMDDLHAQLSEFEQRLVATDYQGCAELLDLIDVDYLLRWGHANKVRLMREKLDGKIQKKELMITHNQSIGLAYRGLGYLEKAIIHFENMLSEARDIQDLRSQIKALNELSNAYRRLARYDKALEASQKALLVAEEFNDKEGVGNALGDIGKINWCIGNYSEADRYCTQAIDILRKVGNLNGAAYSLGCLGSTCVSTKEYNNAITYYLEALDLFKKVKNKQGEAYVYQDIGYAYLHIKDFEKAIEFESMGLKIYLEIANQRGVGHCAFILARISREKDDIDAALRYAELADSSLSETRVPESATAKALFYSLRAYSVQNRLEEARYLFEVAVNPPNTGDLQESVSFAEKAAALAKEYGDENLYYKAQKYIENHGQNTTK